MFLKLSGFAEELNLIICSHTLLGKAGDGCCLLLFSYLACHIFFKCHFHASSDYALKEWCWNILFFKYIVQREAVEWSTGRLYIVTFLLEGHFIFSHRSWSSPSKWGLLGPCESNRSKSLLWWRKEGCRDHVLCIHEAGIKLVWASMDFL